MGGGSSGYLGGREEREVRVGLPRHFDLGLGVRRGADLDGAAGCVLGEEHERDAPAR